MAAAFVAACLLAVASANADLICPPERADTQDAAPVDVSIDLSRRQWTAQPSWLGNAAKQYSDRYDDQQSAVVFSVTGSSVGMKWSCELDQVFPLETRLFLSVRYRARNLSKSSDYVFCLLGEPKEGGKGYESVLNADADVSGSWQTAVIPLDEAGAKLGTVRAVAAQVFSAGPGAELAISEMRLTSERPTTPVTDTVPYVLGPAPEGFDTCEIAAECNQSLQGVIGALYLDGWPAQEDITAFGVPFRLRQEDPRLAATGIAERSTLTIPIGRKTSQICLLLFAVMTGREEAVYGGGMLRRLAEPERFLFLLEYEDGTTTCIPANVSSGEFDVQNGIQMLSMIADPAKDLKSVSLRDNSAQAGFAIAAVTCRTHETRLFRQFDEDLPLTRVERWKSPHPEATSRCVVDKAVGSVYIENEQIRLAADLKNGCSLRELHDKVADYSLNRSAFGSPLFILEINGKPVEPNEIILMSAIELQGTIGARLKLAVASCPGLSISVQLESVPDGGIGIQYEQTNNGASPVKTALTVCPVASCRLQGDPAADMWVFPKWGMAIGRGSATLEAQYCGIFPLQFMGVVNPGSGTGIFLHTQDVTCLEKSYSLVNCDKGISLAVSYPERALNPGETRPSAYTVIRISDGDWRRGLNVYRKWLETWYQPAAPRRAWFREVFNFRQRFLHWLDPLCDPTTGLIDVQRAVTEANTEFGGIEYLHLFDWGNCGPYGRIYGRKGDYSPYDYLTGGRQALSQAVAGVRSMGIPVGLYIEGYLLEERGKLGAEHGTAWQIVGPTGNCLRWPQSTELYICPGVKDWQEIQSQTYAEKVSELDVDGMYLDEFGFQSSDRACYATDHGHPVPSYPPLTELDLTKKVREALDKTKSGVALYTEESPCDVVSQYQDGSFTYAMNQTRTSGAMAPLNLFRFAIPDFKTFEILVCDQPTGSWAQGVRWVFFNGEGLWLEGPGGEWFSPETRDTIRKCHSILCAHKDAFTSDHPEPLVDTQASLIFANRFPANGTEVWTLYNARHSTYSGPVLRLPHAFGTEWADAWNGTAADVVTENDQDTVNYTIGPLGVGCLVRTLSVENN